MHNTPAFQRQCYRLRFEQQPKRQSSPTTSRQLRLNLPGPVDAAYGAL